MLNVDICRNFPTESLVKQVVLRSRCKILVSSYNVCDAHKVIVNNVCKVICRHSVCLYKYLIVKSSAVNCDIAVKLIMESNLALQRDLLSDNVRYACIKLCLYLLSRKITAVSVIHRSDTACLLNSFQLFKSFLVAEAVVSLALFNKLLSIFLEHTHSFRLDIRTDRTAYIRTFVPVESALFKSFVNYLSSALYITSLIRILYSEDKISAVLLCDKVCEQRCSEVSDMHIACRAWRKSGSYFIH